LRVKNMKKSITLKEIADKIGASISQGTGEDQYISGFTTLEAAGENDLSFVTSPKFQKQAEKSGAAAIITLSDLTVEGKTVLKVCDVWKSVITLLEIFYPEPEPGRICDPTSYISPDAKIGENVTVGQFAVIESGAIIGDNSIIGPLSFIAHNVSIGENTFLHPGVSILKNCKIGNRCILHTGVVIGSDGFKYEVIDGLPTKIPQVGIVVVEDDVEMGANTCIDRASLTETRICRGAKLDNLIQIAHNVEIGPYTMIAAQAGIAGSTKIGAGCIFGGQSAVRDNVKVGAGVMLAAKSGISKDTPSGMKLYGMISRPAKEMLKLDALVLRLPKMVKTIKDLEKRISELENK
jgi:UDP-3-O-[3-hydroxymyristoyl] glucosamine N-acyltransferase